MQSRGTPTGLDCSKTNPSAAMGSSRIVADIPAAPATLKPSRYRSRRSRPGQPSLPGTRTTPFTVYGWGLSFLFNTNFEGINSCDAHSIVHSGFCQQAFLAAVCLPSCHSISRYRPHWRRLVHSPSSPAAGPDQDRSSRRTGPRSESAAMRPIVPAAVLATSSCNFAAQAKATISI